MDMHFIQTVGHWHDFYVTLTTVTGALVGLLFVALSVNLNLLAQNKGVSPLRSLAPQVFVSFTSILFIGFIFLIPDVSPQELAELLLVLSVLGLVWSVFMWFFIHKMNLLMADATPIDIPPPEILTEMEKAASSGQSHKKEYNTLGKKEEYDWFVTGIFIYFGPSLYWAFQLLCYIALVVIVFVPIRTAQTWGLYWIAAIIALMGGIAIVGSWSLLVGASGMSKFIEYFKVPTYFPPDIVSQIGEASTKVTPTEDGAIKKGQTQKTTAQKPAMKAKTKKATIPKSIQKR